MQHPTAQFSDLAINASIEDKKLLSMINSKVVFAQKARGAIFQLLKSLPKGNGDTVLMPAFHCPTVVHPALLAGYKVKFFQINEDLSIDDEINSLIDDSVAAIIVIHYFGFTTKMTHFEEKAGKSNSLIIEDWSHSFLQNKPLRLAGSDGNASVFSFWKLVPCHVGGGFINRSELALKHAEPLESSSLMQLVKYQKQLIEQMVNSSNSSVLRQIFLFFEKLRKRSHVANNPQSGNSIEVNAEQSSYPLDKSLFTKNIPWLSKRILSAAPLGEIVRKRRTNYMQYLGNFVETKSCKPFYKNLPEDTCPWCFPVLMENRSNYDFKLKQKGVPFFTFGEKLHPLVDDNTLISMQAREIAKYLSTSTICFSIHQKILPTSIGTNTETIATTLI